MPREERVFGEIGGFHFKDAELIMRRERKYNPCCRILQSCSVLMGNYKDEGARLFLVVPNDIRRGSGPKQQLGDVPAGHKRKNDSLGRQCSVGARFTEGPWNIHPQRFSGLC